MRWHVRWYRGRIEHLSADRVTTFCGLSTELATLFRASERGQDAKVRPLCHSCRIGAREVQA